MSRHAHVSPVSCRDGLPCRAGRARRSSGPPAVLGGTAAAQGRGRAAVANEPAEARV